MSDATFYIKPQPSSTVTAREVHDTLAQQFAGTGLGITGTFDTEPPPCDDGTWEVRTSGPAGAEALSMVLRYCFWEIDHEGEK